MCTVYQMEGKWNTCTEVNSYTEGVKHLVRENLSNSVCCCWHPWIFTEVSEDSYVFCVCRRH